MKPRNAREREVVRLYNKLPELSHSQRLWIEDHIVGARIFTSGHSCWCTKCGGKWKVGTATKTMVCPHCGTESDVTISRKSTDSGICYAQFLHVFRGWQVIRTTLIQWYCAKGREQKIYDMDVWQKWCQPGKPMITLGAKLGMAVNYRDIPYSIWGGPLSIKGSHDYFYKQWMEVEIYPKYSLLPIYKKNLGYRPIFGLYDAPTLLGDIFGNPYLESLYKARNHAKLAEMLKQVEGINKYWPSVKVMLRHGYEPQHWPTYFEHLKALRFLHYDMRSPRYVAPKDFGQLHELVMRQYKNRLDMMQEKAEQARMLKYALQEEELNRLREESAKEYAKTFAERIAKFAGLQIEGKDIVIKPLMSIEEFKDEGNAMHHCVFTNNYWKNKDCLILSARTRSENERVETIEVSLTNFVILQSQGIYNAPTKRHNEIANLVMGAMPKIRQMAMAI